MIKLLFLLISFSLTVSGGLLSHSTRSSLNPGRRHKIFVENSNETGICVSLIVYTSNNYLLLSPVNLKNLKK